MQGSTTLPSKSQPPPLRATITTRTQTGESAIVITLTTCTHHHIKIVTKCLLMLYLFGHTGTNHYSWNTSLNLLSPHISSTKHVYVCSYLLKLYRIDKYRNHKQMYSSCNDVYV